MRVRGIEKHGNRHVQINKCNEVRPADLNTLTDIRNDFKPNYLNNLGAWDNAQLNHDIVIIGLTFINVYVCIIRAAMCF